MIFVKSRSSKQSVYKVKKYPGLITALLFSIIAFSQQPQAVQLSSITEVIDGKEFYIHMVRPGQTLQAIAAAYKASVEEINRENPGLKGVVSAGNLIRIPKKAAVRQVDTQQQAWQEIDTRQQQLPEKQRTTHTVAPQETFFGIARQYSITIAALRAANPTIEALQPGQVLIIPSSEGAGQENSSEPLSPPAKPAVETEKPQAQPKPGDLPETYTVLTGETLFSISRRFGLTVEELLHLNPEVKDGLKAGQTIRLKERDEINQEYKIIKEYDTIVNYIYHRVRRGETLYGLGQRYEISIDDILKYNPHALDGLQPRQVLQIPVYEIIERRVVREVTPVEPVETPTDTVDIQPVPIECHPLPDPEKVYNIAIMLPFFLDPPMHIPDESDTLGIIPEPNPNKPYEFMQFYYGAMLAIDSLKREGLNARVYVYDVDNTQESVTRFLENPELLYMDLFIGPLFAGSFERVARYAREHQINIVNPLSVRSDFLLGNPNVIKAQSTNKDQVNLIAAYIRDNFYDHNIIVVRQFSFSETETLEVLQNQINTSDLHDVIFIRDSLDGIIRHLDSLGPNIVIGLSADRVFALDLVRKLNDIRSDFDITCFGMNEWEDFAIDTDHSVNIRLHLPTYNFIDYNSPQVKQFIKAFRAQYATEPLPGRFAFAAFDLTYYFVSALMQFGDAFNQCLPHYRYRGLQMPFEFEPKQWHGLENTGLCIYKIDGFRKEEVYPQW